MCILQAFFIFIFFSTLVDDADFRKCANNPRISAADVDQEFKKYVLDKFKRSFLQELRMERPPAINDGAKNSVIRQLKHFRRDGIVYENSLEYEGGCNYGQAVDERRQKRQIAMPQEPQMAEQFILAGISTVGNRSAHDSGRSYFNLSALHAGTITKATIILLLAANSVDQLVNFWVYEYINDNEIAMQPVYHRTVAVDPSGQLHADITALVRKWVGNPERNFGVLIRAEGNRESFVNRTLDNFNRTENIILHLEFAGANLNPLWDVISHRPGKLCSRDQPEENCCRYPLEVNMEDVGFGFVISPKRINIFYCSGECPFGHLLTSRHAHMMQQASAIMTGNENPPNLGPCCVPTEFTNVTVVYMPDDYTVKETSMVNIIALRCGCS